MKCPVCKTVSLHSDSLDADLLTSTCDQCGGHWVKSFQYWQWREAHANELPPRDEPEPGAPGDLPHIDSLKAKLCPECGHLLTRCKVGHGLGFHLDKCAHCGGFWFDRNEWEILRAHNIHRDLHFIFTQAWQAKVHREEQQRAEVQRLLGHFGEADLAELERIKRWIETHPRTHEVRAFLNLGRQT